MKINPTMNVVIQQNNISKSKNNRNDNSIVSVDNVVNTHQKLSFKGSWKQALTNFLTLFSGKPGCWDHKFEDILDQTRRGDGHILIRFLKDGAISSTEEHKKSIIELRDKLNPNKALARVTLEDALVVIDEKLAKK